MDLSRVSQNYPLSQIQAKILRPQAHRSRKPIKRMSLVIRKNMPKRTGQSGDPGDAALMDIFWGRYVNQKYTLVQ